MSFEEEARNGHRSGMNCAMAVCTAYADMLGVDKGDIAAFAPRPRGEGGKCGAYLAGKKVLSSLKPSAVEEFEHRFVAMYGHTSCPMLLAAHKSLGKNCNDFVGETAALIEELLGVEDK